MFGWGVSLAVAASAAILLALLITLTVRRCYRFSKQGTKVSEATTGLPQIRTNTKGLQQSQRISRPAYNLFRRGSSTKPLFSWADHPSMIADAVENGWSRFSFTNYSSSSTTRSPLLGCVEREARVEMTWEVGDGSVDFMQKIRMNPETKKFNSNCSSIVAKSAIRTALPLPGPPMGNPHSFPQEAYFEITLLSVSSSLEYKVKAEGEKTKLIGEKKSDGKGNLDALNELRVGNRVAVMMSMGLTSSSLVPLKFPGSYHGSIGFNSDGSVYLDGMKLVLESEKEESWGQEEKVIGCGFDPRRKKVFFTVDSRLIEVVHCKPEEFGFPLYPIIAANGDMTVLVNLGQRRFSYEPANELRTPNPCFIGPLLRSPAALGYEDSGELFSMGRIDAGWHHNCNSNNGSRVDGDDDEDESEADLFEIVLDVNEKSPNV